jgi:LysR family hydrogen peroxide-inducible transcriptional activator
MKNLPSLKQFEYLVALAEVVHFGQASEICNVTPSTLSAGIRDLEETIGVALAERTKRHVMMTSLGKEIAVRAQRLLRDAEEIMDLAASQQQPMTGDLKLGVIPTIGPFLLPKVTPKIHRKYPKLRLFLREEQTAILLDRVRNGELDAAVIALPFDLDGLDHTSLFEDPFAFICPKDHSLADHEMIVENDLVDEPLLLLEEGHCLRDHAMQACQISQHQYRLEFEATSLHTLVQMVAAGLGVTLLPKMAVDAGVLRGTRTSIVPLVSGAPAREIALVWRSTSPQTQTFRLLGQMLTPAKD